jgi:hypothetical protein
MTAIKPLSDVTAIDCSSVNLDTDPVVLNDFVLYKARQVRVTNLSDQAVAVMRCEATANFPDTGNANSISVDAGFGVGAIILAAGETVIIDKRPGGRLWDDDASEWVANPPEIYHGDVIRITDEGLLAGGTPPTTGKIYISVVTTAY